jgi:5-methylcytosine-specific restriction endonuclease McrA
MQAQAAVNDVALRKGNAASKQDKVAEPSADGSGAKRGSKGGPGSGKRATRKQREAALKENDGKCVFCGKPATEVDHAVPKSRNGDTTKKNLQPTCQTCNRQKGKKTTTEYKKWKKPKSN